MRLRNDDFTFYDYEQTPRWRQLREERDARIANRLHTQAPAPRARSGRSMFAWIQEGIQALLPGSRLL
jgi:hypothetical protein